MLTAPIINVLPFFSGYLITVQIATFICRSVTFNRSRGQTKSQKIVSSICERESPKLASKTLLHQSQKYLTKSLFKRKNICCKYFQITKHTFNSIYFQYFRSFCENDEECTNMHSFRSDTMCFIGFENVSHKLINLMRYRRLLTSYG